MSNPGKFCEADKHGVYRAIEERRDVRSGFSPEPLSEQVLLRILGAGHHAPSVGFMQPWRFLLVRSRSARMRVHEIFIESNRAAMKTYDGAQARQYADLKLEGILEAPQNLCVLCDPDNEQGHRLGRHSMPETAIYSAVCAVQNLWLAARAEGVGVGWVSILDPAALKQVLGVPSRMVVVAYLCIGYVDSFGTLPELERLGWEKRMPLAEVLHLDHFDRPYFTISQRQLCHDYTSHYGSRNKFACRRVHFDDGTVPHLCPSRLSVTYSSLRTGIIFLGH